MIVTALLVRYSDGWHERTSPAAIAAHGRKEAALGLGASTSLAEVDTVSDRQLVIFGDPRTEIACDLKPRDATDTPYVAFGTADRIPIPDLPGRPPAPQRVQAITVTQAGDEVTYAVELRDVLLDERERFAEALTKMANGTLGGDSRVAQPVSTVGVVDTVDCCPPPIPHWIVFSEQAEGVADGSTSVTLTTGPGGEVYPLSTFSVTIPSGFGNIDGQVPLIELIQYTPEAVATVAARVDLGYGYEAGVYQVSVIYEHEIHIGGGWGLAFLARGISTPFRVVAEFATATAPDTELAWSSE